MFLFSAFILGAIGSLHCVGMCGPLAFSLPVVKQTPSGIFTGSLLYNSGRLGMYALLGALLGSIGYTATFFGMQKWLSLSAGILLLLIWFTHRNAGKNFLPGIFTGIRQTLGRLYTSKNYSSLLLIGLLNGLLPCGLVYVAMAGAVAGGTISESALFMLFFGLGTLPLMWSISFFGFWFNAKLRQKILKVYPYMMLLMAFLLIIRGLGLGIPYLSPSWENNAVNCHE